MHFVNRYGIASIPPSPLFAVLLSSVVPDVFYRDEDGTNGRPMGLAFGEQALADRAGERQKAKQQN